MILRFSIAALTLAMPMLLTVGPAAAKQTPRCGQTYDHLPSAKTLATTPGTLTLNESAFKASTHGKVSLTVVGEGPVADIPNGDNNPFEGSQAPAVGDVFFAVHLLVANHGTDPVALSQIDDASVHQQMFLTDGRRRWHSEQSGYPLDVSIQEGVILESWRPNPGDVVFDTAIGPGAAGSVWLAYDVPPTAHPAGLVYDDDTNNNTYQPIGFWGLPACAAAKR